MTRSTPGESYFVPVTPAGTRVFYGAGAMMGAQVAAITRDEAIRNLLIDAAHMPYKTWENFEKRGYTIEEVKGWAP